MSRPGARPGAPPPGTGRAAQGTHCRGAAAAGSAAPRARARQKSRPLGAAAAPRCMDSRMTFGYQSNSMPVSNDSNNLNSEMRNQIKFFVQFFNQILQFNSSIQFFNSILQFNSLNSPVLFNPDSLFYVLLSNITILELNSISISLMI